MVGANTFRNPGLTAKLATTLDHVSGGRAVLGIGGAWFEREHDGFGIDFGASVGERLDRLDESVMLMRRLLDGERFSHEGRFYTFHDALCAPRPIQAPAADPGRRLRAAQDAADRRPLRADGWNTIGHGRRGARQARRSWREHCADVGRDIADDREDVSFPIILRDDAPTAEAAYATR